MDELSKPHSIHSNNNINTKESKYNLLNKDLYLTQIENIMAAIEDQNLINDQRYFKLRLLKEKLSEGLITVENDVDDNKRDEDMVQEKKVNVLTSEQLNHLKAQVTVYKLLARNKPISKSLLNQLNSKNINDTFLTTYEVSSNLNNSEKTSYDSFKILSMHQQRSYCTKNVQPTVCIDPQIILKERENRIQNRIGSRLQELKEVPFDINENLRIKAEIELRALRLLNFQTQIREEVLSYLKRDTTLETALNPYAYRRTKRHPLREARITEKLEKQQKIEQDRRRRFKHLELLQAIVQASKDFREFHKNAQGKIAKLRKAVITYHANSEKERKKDELKNEKMRIMKLMEEDDVGYRQLLDEKKDKRLVFLLKQTDEYVESLTGFVKQHQATEKKRKRQEKREARMALKQQSDSEDIHVIIRNCVTGEILKGDSVPKMNEIVEWMENNPGYEVVSRDAISDSDDEKTDDDEDNNLKIEEKKNDELEGLDEEQRDRIIIEKARNEEDEYDLKTKSQMESYFSTAHRIKEKIVKQHSTMGGGDPTLLLKPYQLKGLEWMVSLYNNNLNGILADEMGLGKTIQTISLVTYLMEVKKVNGPYLIIVPLSTISNWKLELMKWAPNVMTIVFNGHKEARKLLEGQIRKGTFNVLLTTYDYALKERSVLGKIRWKYIIIDEGHRMKNYNCKLTTTLNAYFHAQHRLLLTGTPLQNKLPELWALLNFLLPSIFSSCATFEQWFNAPFATTCEKVELSQEETMLIIRRLHKVLRPFLLRRLKKEVESQLPDKIEYVIKCDMSALQKILYKHLQKGLLIDSKHQGGHALSNIIVHLRKLCNHPFLFSNVEEDCRQYWKEEINGKHLYRVAGKFELLDRILPKLKATNHRVLIFCQMTLLMNIMEDFFQYREWKYLRLDGKTKQEDRANMLNEFNAENSDYFIFILSTRAGGLGLNLQTADTVILFDSDWNPHQDMQAQDRAHRIGQTREVRVLRFITANSIEEKILAAARFKLNVDEKVIQAGKFDQRSTGAERKQMLEAIIRAENEENNYDEITKDAQLNEYLARSEEEIELFSQMDYERIQNEENDKPRLIGDDEIPLDIVIQSKKFTENEERAANANNTIVEVLTDVGRRKRKDDLMSDREWLKTINDAFGDYNDDEEDEQIKKKKRKLNVSDAPETTLSKRGRKKKRIVDSDGSNDDEQYNKNIKKKRADLDEERLNELLNKAFNALITYKTSGGGELAEPFIQLPPRRELPDYYEIIERPMDLNRIKKKIKDGRYSSFNEMSDDVELLCSNAQKYNIEESEIFNSSVLLSAVWKRIYNGLRNVNETNILNSNNLSTNESSENKREEESSLNTIELNNT